ncbi:MAG: bifunctional hydroxymethylpyrimidine kinase/phosphomethylpyrimidine kinase [Rhodomicrobium sp.]
MKSKTPVLLTMSGSDSSACAGLQADLKTASALGVYCATVVTAITAQNTYEVTRVYSLPPEVISAQIDAVFSDLCVWSVKTGMLGSAETILAVAKGLERWAAGVPVIVDPVMVSTTGTSLLEAGAQQTLVEKLMPMAALVTPNLEEAAALTGSPVARDEEEAKEQAAKLLALGPRAVLLKGGHGGGSEARDLYYDGKAFRVYSAPRIAMVKGVRGTGCTLASAIASLLVRGLAMEEAIGQAKAYVHGAIEHAAGLEIGRGSGPVSHFYRALTALR